MVPPADVAKRWLIGGAVQGVGFRWFTRRQALRLGLSGWVANLRDGRVEVVARGTPAALAELDQAVRSGPTLARVDSVEITEVPHEMVDHKTFVTK